MSSDFVRDRLPKIVAVCSVPVLSLAMFTPDALASCDPYYGCGSTSTSHPSVLLATGAAVIQAERAETKESANQISSRAGSALAPSAKVAVKADAGQLDYFSSQGSATGVSSGDSGYTTSAWASYAHSWLRNTWVPQYSHANLDSGTIGLDVLTPKNILAGITFTYSASANTTNHNDGSSNSDSYTFTPYAAISLLDNRLLLDVMSGGGFSDTDSNRNVGAVTGKFNGTHWMAAAHATYNFNIDKVTLSPKIGWLSQFGATDRYSESDATLFPSTTTRLGEFSVGGKATLDLGTVLPYGGMTYAHDFSLSTDDVTLTGKQLGRDELGLAIGVDWHATDRLTASLEATHTLFRAHEENTGVSVSGRFEF